MGLATMVRLMIEEVRQNITKGLLLWLARCGQIAVELIQFLFVIAAGEGDNPFVLAYTCTG